LSSRHLRLLSPRMTWKKRFDNILLSKFDNKTQGTSRINFSIKPSFHTVSYAAVRSINTTPVLSFRWKQASICDVSTKTCSVQYIRNDCINQRLDLLKDHSLKYLKNDTEQCNWPKIRRIRTIFSRFRDLNSFAALEQFRNFTRRQNIVKKVNDPFFGP
jgi:hypothetical protein